MREIKKILIIIQRSNGDVYLSLSLIKSIYKSLHSPKIDLLVNDDTSHIASLMPYINKIHIFSYQKKKEKRWAQEKDIAVKIFRKYDLSINLTSSDRSVLYAILASKKSVSAIEKEFKKSWWKKLLLSKFYYFEKFNHILMNNLEPLRLLNISHNYIQETPVVSEEIYSKMRDKLARNGIKKYFIFHPSAQYKYKIYPRHLRNQLLGSLSTLGIPIIVTGSNNVIDNEIKKELPILSNIYDMIGETSMAEYFALSEMALAYIGMDTLNMHIAAGQNKTIFAIFGPTNLSMWAPWSNSLKGSTDINKPLQTYGNITIFQANMPCVACGNAGCDGKGRSECLYSIQPELIFNEIENWYKNA